MWAIDDQLCQWDKRWQEQVRQENVLDAGGSSTGGDGRMVGVRLGAHEKDHLEDHRRRAIFRFGDRGALEVRQA